MTKKLIKIGAGKGKLLGVTNKYLESLGFEPIDKKSRQLIHHFTSERYELEVTLLRWEDIKRYTNNFDMIVYGADQWLESGSKSMIALRYFEQENCRLSLMVPKEKADMPLSYFRTRKIATGYRKLLKEYVGIQDESLIVDMSGSVEAAIGLDWAESIFDVVESGATAKEHGLIERKTYINFGAILATSKPEIIPVLADLGLIDKLTDGYTIAFDGVDGSGKSSLAKYFVQKGLGDGRPTVLVCPYSGSIGTSAKSLLDSGYVAEWADSIGKNHWRPPVAVNGVYDRSILTFLTELIKEGLTGREIADVVNSWKELPRVIFYCHADYDTLRKRVSARGSDMDEYDTDVSLKQYIGLYNKAAECAVNMGINVVSINTDRSINESIDEIKGVLNRILKGREGKVNDD